MSHREDRQALSLPTVPVAYVRLLLKVLEERGFARDTVLHGTGLEPGLLEQAERRLPPALWAQICFRAIALCNDEGLGCELGLRSALTAHGFLGYAAMAGQTLREALVVATRYLRTRTQEYALHSTERAGRILIELRARQPLALLEHHFPVEQALISILQSLIFLHGEAPRNLWLHFKWPEPAYHQRYRDRLPPVEFSSTINGLSFPSEHLDHRLPLADSAAHQQALVQLEREYVAVWQDADSFVSSARAQLVLSEKGYPELAALAETLRISTRTLKRRLKAEGTSYSNLLQEALYRDARRLIEASDLDIQSISARLGFENPANFTRAFRRWSGQTPTQVRQARLIES
ncbi:MAG: AraC family transcriptional regulator ligand-binding domain-containing protein [Pseudomonadota bacterium]